MRRGPTGGAAPEDINDLYRSASALSQDCYSQLDLLESSKRGTGDATEGAADLRNDVSNNLNRLAYLVDALQRQVPLQTEAGRLKWKTRVNTLSGEVESMRASLAKFLSKSYATERTLLLAGGGRTGASASHIDTVAEESASLNRSNTMMSEYIDQGVAVLDQLRGERIRLKSMHKVVLDIAGSLGISNNLMNVISRRGAVDKALVYGGMLIVLLVLWLAYKFIL